MKVRGFGARRPRNVSSGGKTWSFDEYNRSFKGDPYNFAYKKEHYRDMLGYMDRSVEEYHHYQEQQDLTSEEDDSKKEKDRKNDSKKRRKKLIQQAIVLVAGSVVLVSAYKANAANNTPPVDDTSIIETIPDDGGDDASDDDNKKPEEELSISWRWSEDGTSAVMVIKDSSGKTVAEVKAVVETTEVPAGCRTEGSVTSLAKASWKGKDYSDTRTVTLPALGHAFGDGVAVTLEDGQPAMEYECTRCHEHFTVITSITEE